MSWYSGRDLTQVEQSYVDLLESIFKVQNEYQKWIPYEMIDYQKEYHAESINIKMEDAQDIVVIKARGTSFTTSTIIDYIMTGITFENLMLPIIAQRYDSAKNFVHRAQNIIKNCDSEEIKNNVSFSRNEIYFKNGSSMIPYPSSSAADAVRGERLIRVFIDEFAFQQQDSELLAAAEQTMRGQLGQIMIGSTPCGRNNKFADIIKKERDASTYNNIYKIIKWPVFDPKKFNENEMPSSQNLEPIAPWISIKKLDKEWKKDKNIFLQENMCSLLDDHLSYISYKEVIKVNTPNNFNYKEKVFNTPGFKYYTQNPIVFGHDYAETTDYCAITGFEVIDGKFYKQIFLDYYKGRNIPEQQEYVKSIIQCFPTLQKYRIDMTGPGIGLYQNMKNEFQRQIEGIDFRTSIQVGDNSKTQKKQNIRKYMIINLKSFIDNEQMSLIQDSMQTAHLTAIDYSLKVQRNSEHHGDILFANALALLPDEYMNVNNSDAIMSGDRNEKNKEKEQGDIMDRINIMRRKRMKKNIII